MPSIVLTHDGSPYISGYQWSEATGFGAKHANPAMLPSSAIMGGLAFSPAGDAVVYSQHGGSFGNGAYAWDSGFATKYFYEPFPHGSAGSVTFTPDSLTVFFGGTTSLAAYPWSSSSLAGFGDRYPTPSGNHQREGVAVSPDGLDVVAGNYRGGDPIAIEAYPWSSAGFGPRYADPGSLPPAGQLPAVGFAPDGAAVFAGGNTSPYLHAYEWNRSFGTKYANPGTLAPANIYRLAVSPVGPAVIHGTNAAPYIMAYPWSPAGFGPKFANPAVTPVAMPIGIAARQNGDGVAAAHSGSPYVTAYPWSAAGFGPKYSNPATMLPGDGVGVAFEPTTPIRPPALLIASQPSARGSLVRAESPSTIRVESTINGYADWETGAYLGEASSGGSFYPPAWDREWFYASGTYWSSYIGGIRFRLNAPQGETLSKATLRLRNLSTWGPGEVYIDADTVDDAPPWSAGSTPHHITPTVARGTLAIAGSENAVAIDITAVVQEIVSRPGWQTGNHIRFALTTDGSAGLYAPASRDGGGEPDLVVEWAARIPPPPVDIGGNQPAASGSLTHTTSKSAQLAGTQPYATGALSLRRPISYRKVAGAQPAASGGLAPRRPYTQIALAGSQPTATGSVAAVAAKFVDVAGAQPPPSGGVTWRHVFFREHVAGAQPAPTGSVGFRWSRYGVAISGAQAAPVGDLAARRIYTQVLLVGMQAAASGDAGARFLWRQILLVGLQEAATGELRGGKVRYGVGMTPPAGSSIGRPIPPAGSANAQRIPPAGGSVGERRPPPGISFRSSGG